MTKGLMFLIVRVAFVGELTLYDSMVNISCAGQGATTHPGGNTIMVPQEQCTPDTADAVKIPISAPKARAITLSACSWLFKTWSF
jgi:hypothetical protein